MPEWLGWLENVSTIKWVFYAYCVNEYTGLDLECDDIDPNTGCLETGEEVLELLSFDQLGLWTPTGILAGLLVGFHILAFGCLSVNNEKYMECEEPSGDESNGHYGTASNGAASNGAASNGAGHMVMDQELKVKSTSVKVHQKTPLLKS